MAEPRFAISGASGELGGRVARQLAEHGISQRLIVRDASRAPALPEATAVEASYDDADAMRRALHGIQTWYFVSAAEAEHRLQQHKTAVDAAVDAGVERIVYVSFLGAAENAVFTLARDHFRTEQHIIASGVRYTMMRDSLYLDFIPRFVAPDGMLRGPAGDGVVAPVARDDIADAAVPVLLSDDHDEAIYSLTGPTAFTLAEAVAIIGERVGRPLTYVDESITEAYESRASYGAPQWEVDGWVSSYVAIAKGELALVTDDVRTLSGREPMSLPEYLDRHPDSYAHLLDAG